MRCEAVRGRWAVLAAVLVVVFACAAPPKTIASLQSPTPSPSPTPTAPLQAAGPGFHVGEVGVGYAPVALSATGGVAPYKWTVSAGSLPAGLALGSDGSVSGNPTSAGGYAFTIQVADSGNSTATISGTIGIAAPVIASLLSPCAQYCNVELGCVTVCGTFGTLGGGVAPYSYAVTQGTLPAGTSLSTLSLTGTFGGLPGYLKFTVQVTDALGGTSSISPTFWMYPHISFAGGSVPVNRQNAGCYAFGGGGCVAQFPYSGGTPGAGTPAVTASWVTYTCAAPPPMPTFSVGNGMVTVAIPPARLPDCNGYTGTVNVVLTNRDQCASGPAYCYSSAPVYLQQSGT